MRKIYATLIAIFALVLCIVTVGAEEIPADPEEDRSVVVEDATPTEDAAPPDATEPTEQPPAEDVALEATTPEAGGGLLSRAVNNVTEFIEWHKDRIIMIVGFIATLYFTIMSKRGQRKDNEKNTAELAVIDKGIVGLESVMNRIIDGFNDIEQKYNQLSESYDAMREKYAEYEGIEDDRNKIVSAVMLECSAILDIVVSVYSNSSHLPQGEKDLIMYKFSKCLSALDNDEKLRSCIEAVRSVLSTDKAEAKSEAKR